MQTIPSIRLLLLSLPLFSSLSYGENTSWLEALSQGQWGGEIRNVATFGSKTDAGPAAGPFNNAHSASSALALTYTTKRFHGFQIGLGVQSGIDWKIHKHEGDLTTEDDARNTVTATEVHQAYIDYQFDPAHTNTQVRLGRQGIVTPLVISSIEFPMRDAFDAVVVRNSDLPHTQLQLMYIDSWIKRQGGDALRNSINEENDYFSAPVYSLHLKNSSFANLTLEAQWLHNDSDEPIGDLPTAVAAIGPYRVGFVATDYKIPDSAINLGAKYMGARFDEADSAHSWSIKAGYQFDKLHATLAHARVSDDNNLPGSLGHVPWFKTYTVTFTDSEYIAGTETTSLTLKPHWDINGLRTSLTLGYWSQSDEGRINSGPPGFKLDLDGTTELTLDVHYRFQEIKGLSSRLQLSRMDYDRDQGEDGLSYLKLTVNYNL